MQPFTLFSQLGHLLIRHHRITQIRFPLSDTALIWSIKIGSHYSTDLGAFRKRAHIAT